MAVVVTRSSVAPAPPEEVWAAVSTLPGVNRELGPFVTMREPAAYRGRTFDSFEPGERGHCWLLAGGVVPFDRHHLGLESITPGVGFVEESSSWLQKRWRHERTLEPSGDGTRVTDRLVIEPRLAPMAPLVGRLVGALFTHRHRRLAAHLRRATEPPSASPTAGRPNIDEQDLAFVDRAPVRVTASVEAEATPEAVWAVLVDHRRWPDWFGPSLVSVRPTSTAETGVGSTRSVRIRGGTSVAERFIAWDEPRLWAFTATEIRPRIFSALVERVVLEPLGDGRTTVTYTMAIDPAPPLRRLAPLLRRGLERSLTGALGGLANRSRGQRTQASTS